jgi:hypothetical protein
MQNTCFIEIFDETKETVPILKRFVGPFLTLSSSLLSVGVDGLEICFAFGYTTI